MISRRHVLMSSGCFLAAGAAYGLKPSRHVSLLRPGQDFAQTIPSRCGEWVGRDVGDLFAPTTEDALTTKLYETLVGRTYRHNVTGSEVVALIAYGVVQSNALQIHRPEVCYPAFGYNIVSNRVLALPLARNVILPTRQLTARSLEEQQTVVYWTRLGEYLPTSGGEQRLDRMKTALSGNIVDGVLARFSMPGNDDVYATKVLGEFITQLLGSVAAHHLPVLIGTERAKLLSASNSVHAQGL